MHGNGIGIVVLNNLMKRVKIKPQSLLAFDAMFTQSHVITLVTIHDFIFQLSMTSLTRSFTAAGARN